VVDYWVLLSYELIWSTSRNIQGGYTRAGTNLGAIFLGLASSATGCNRRLEGAITGTAGFGLRTYNFGEKKTVVDIQSTRVGEEGGCCLLNGREWKPVLRKRLAGTLRDIHDRFGTLRGKSKRWRKVERQKMWLSVSILSLLLVSMFDEARSGADRGVEKMEKDIWLCFPC
jgi:hypothetical protein